MPHKRKKHVPLFATPWPKKIRPLFRPPTGRESAVDPVRQAAKFADHAPFFDYPLLSYTETARDRGKANSAVKRGLCKLLARVKAHDSSILHRIRTVLDVDPPSEWSMDSHRRTRRCRRLRARS